MEKFGEIEPELNGLPETGLFLSTGSRIAISWLQRPKILPSESARVNHRGLDTQRLLQIAGAIGLLIVGKYLDRWFTRKPKLISYIGHVSAFTLRTDPPKAVYTHAIVVINVGRLHATNVRIGRAVL